MGREYGERLDPQDALPRLLQEHVARYEYAYRFVRDRRTLDVACGTGYGSSLLLRGGASAVVGMDADMKALSIARRLALDCALVLGDAQRLPFRSASYDACVCIETLEHVPDPSLLVGEIARVLRPGGPLVISTPNAESREIPHDNPYHLHEYSARELLALLEVHFTVIQWAGQYPAHRGLRHRMRAWLARSGAADLVRRMTPTSLRTHLGGGLAGSPAVVQFVDPNETSPATLVLVAAKR